MRGTPLRSPLIGPVCVCVNRTNCTTVWSVKQQMPVVLRGPTTPLFVSGEGSASTVAVSSRGTRKDTKTSVFPSASASVTPFQCGSFTALTGSTR